MCLLKPGIALQGLVTLLVCLSNGKNKHRCTPTRWPRPSPQKTNPSPVPKIFLPRPYLCDRFCPPSYPSLRSRRTNPHRLLRRTSRRGPTPAGPILRRLIHRRRQKWRVTPLAGAARPSTPRHSDCSGRDWGREERALLDLFLRETVFLVPELVQVQAVRVRARRVPKVRRAVLGRSEVRPYLPTLVPEPVGGLGRVGGLGVQITHTGRLRCA